MPHTIALIRPALFCCIFLFVVTETLLSPFYPQFFLTVFGVQDLDYTGWYIFLCRLTVLLCAPLWGLAARHVEVKHLLFLGQAGSAGLTLLLANARTATEFLVLSILLVALKSSYLLLYPLLVQLAGQDQSPTLAARYQGVFHAAIIVSTLVGIGMMLVPAPLRLFYVIALADLIQLGLCAYTLRGVSTRAPLRRTAPAHLLRGQVGVIAAFGLVLVTFHLANNVVRPYFTAYLMATPTPALSLAASGLVFLIPSLMALIAMPFIRLLCTPDRLPGIYLGGLVLLAAGLYVQVWADHVVLLVVGRMLYGLCLAVTHAALDVRLLMGSRPDQLHSNYTWAASAQSLALLTAPLLASALVDRSGMTAPLIAAAGLCLFNLALAGLAMARSPAPIWFSTAAALKKE